MKTLSCWLIAFALLTISIDLKAQQPVLKVDAQDSASISLTKLKTGVKVIGNYAITTMEMTFCNSSNRVLEGELTFPMPEGVTVSRYAIDINGKMREAVSVDKEKGQVVYEEIIRRRIDPGLLEKVQGNNFRTRIYPIPAKGCRNIIIGYEQILGGKDGFSFVYSLPMHFTNPVAAFDFSITVASNYIPEVGSDCDTHLKFEEMNKIFTSSVSKKDFTANGSFTFVIPKTMDAAEVGMQQSNGQYYFLINSFPQVKKIEKKNPNEVSIIWDASLSGINRDHKKELELLDGYIKANRNLTINLYSIDIEFKKINTYFISGGDWSNMKKELEAITYDGATNLASINYALRGDEFLLFSDGMSTFGNIENMILPRKPVYTICAAPTADYSLLKQIAAKTGGNFINLNETEVATALNGLTAQIFQFIGIKPNNNVSNVYPSIPTAVTNTCSIAGICNSGSTSIVLQYGYNGKVSFEQNVDLNIAINNTNFINIEKIWAQKKLAELDMDYDKNKTEISALGKKYSIVTRNSSLIVLDRVEDYVQYEIEPPTELMDEYTRLMNIKRANVTSQTNFIELDAMRYYEDLKLWWTGKTNSPVLSEFDKRLGILRDSIKTTIKLLPSGGEDMSTDVSKNRNPQLRDKSTADTDKDGTNDSEDKCPNEPGPASNVGCPVIAEAIITKINMASKNVYFKSGSSKLENNLSVPQVQVGWDKNTNAFYSSSPNTFAYNSIYDSNGTVSPIPEKPKKTYAWNDSKVPAVINANEFIPERPYLKELNKLPKEFRYKKYLALRDSNNVPTFYLDVANLFFKDADTATGYKILSNIAEVNLDDHESCKMLGYRLKSLGKYDDEVMIFKKILQLRPQEPQSFRDYALALADIGKYQQAVDTLYLALNKNFDSKLNAMYHGKEEIIATEINEIIAQHPGEVNTSALNKDLIKALPVDVRVTLNWNMSDVHLDLFVVDPNGEECYYGNLGTAIGGRLTKHFVQGYGPEQYMLKKSIKGKYKIYVSFFNDSRQRIAGAPTLMTEIYSYYETGREQRKIVTLQLQAKQGERVLVGEFSF